MPWPLFSRAIHPFFSLFVSGLAVALVLLAGGSAGTALLIGVGMLCYQFAIGLGGDVIDAAGDIPHKQKNPLPSGDLSRRKATHLSAIFALAGLVVTFPLPLAAWLIGVAGLICGFVYHAWPKRSPISWLPVAVNISLIPTWVFVASNAWTKTLWWTFPLGAVLGLALHFSNRGTNADAEADRTSRLSKRISAWQSRSLAVLAFGLAGTIAVVVIAFEDTLLGAFAAALTVATGLASTRFRMSGGPTLFGLLAVAGLGLLVFVGPVVVGR